MSKSKQRELRHLICGTFAFDAVTLPLARKRQKREELVGRIMFECQRQCIGKANPSFTRPPHAKRSAPYVLRVVIQEPDPDGTGVASSSVSAARPDDDFAQNLVAYVIEPAARQVFGADVKFAISAEPKV